MFADHNVTFSMCLPADVPIFTINGQSPWSFTQEFQNKLTFEKSHNSCQVLTFPASLKFDNATITFILTDGTEISFLLHVQGEAPSQQSVVASMCHVTFIYCVYRDIEQSRLDLQ